MTFRASGICDPCPRYNSWSTTHSLSRSDHSHICVRPSGKSLIFVRKNGALILRTDGLCNVPKYGDFLGPCPRCMLVPTRRFGRLPRLAVSTFGISPRVSPVPIERLPSARGQAAFASHYMSGKARISCRLSTLCRITHRTLAEPRNKLSPTRPACREIAKAGK
jgi:hypothetical protein